MNVSLIRFKQFVEPLRPINFKEIIASNKYGPRFDAFDYDVSGNVKTIRGTDISQEGEIKYSQVPRAKLDDTLIQDNLLKDGDLIMVTTADCGTTGVFREQKEAYIPSAYAVKIELNKLAHPPYFKYLFQTKRIKEEVNKYVRKGTVANLPLSDIGKIKVNLPSAIEQEKISSFLSLIDEKISHLSQKHELLAAYKKSMTQKIFNQEIRFKDGTGSDYPEWQEKSLSEVTKKKASPISANKIEQNFGNYKIYGASGIIKTIDFFTEENPYVSVVKDGAGVGRAFLCEGKTSVLGTMEMIIPTTSIHVKYLYEVISRINFREYVTGSTIPHVYYKDYSLEVIALPCFEEQKKIASFLTTLDNKISNVQKQIDFTKQYKQGLLQKMFV